MARPNSSDYSELQSSELQQSASQPPALNRWWSVAFEPWTLGVMAIALLFSIPVLVVLGNVFAPAGEIWGRLASTVLPRYIRNSLALMVGVGLGTTVLGVATAWLVSLCQFPGRRFFEWSLLLPIAAPAYVLAYAYTDLFDVAGPFQGWLRATFDWTVRDYWFPQVRTLWGAMFMLVLVLYPYVYLPARLAFLERSRSMLEASLSLGNGPWRTFWRVALPLSRPAIVGGLALVLMETLNDFGTVQFFGVDTFTTGIFRTWFALGERVAATQLAAILLLFILGVLLLERVSRGRTQYHQTRVSHFMPPTYSLTGARSALAILVCTIPLFFGFILPGLTLVDMTLDLLLNGAELTGWLGTLGVMVPAVSLGHWLVVIAQGDLKFEFWEYALNTALLAGVTSGLAIAIALLMAYGVRLQGTPLMRVSARLAAMGYAVPGSVIAVGILVPAGWLDNRINSWMEATFDISTGLLLSGTVTLLVFAYLVRFLAVSFNTIEASLIRIQPSLDDAARSLGYGPLRTLRKVHAPLMTGGLLTAGMLVFVDVVKELPATLVLRPFNFDTMAVRVYRLASDERLAQSAPGALAILLVGTIPAIFLILTVLRSRPRATPAAPVERSSDL